MNPAPAHGAATVAEPPVRHWVARLWRWVVLAAVIVAIATSLAVWWIERQRAAQEAVNALLGAEIKGLEEQIRELATMRSEIAGWQEMEANAVLWKRQRQWPARLLRLLALARPDGVGLTTASETPRGLSLGGRAPDHGRLAALAAALEREQVVRRVDVVALLRDEAGTGLRFTLEIDLDPALRPQVREGAPRATRSRAEDPK